MNDRKISIRHTTPIKKVNLNRFQAIKKATVIFFLITLTLFGEPHFQFEFTRSSYRDAFYTKKNLIIKISTAFYYAKTTNKSNQTDDSVCEELIKVTDENESIHSQNKKKITFRFRYISSKLVKLRPGSTIFYVFGQTTMTDQFLISTKFN